MTIKKYIFQKHLELTIIYGNFIIRLNTLIRMNCKDILFKNIGIHLGSRVHGSETRSRIVKTLNQCDKVVFDFSGVKTISSSFADECFAKLTFIFSIDEIKERTTFINADPFIRAVIANSFKARLSQLEHA